MKVVTLTSLARGRLDKATFGSALNFLFLNYLTIDTGAEVNRVGPKHEVTQKARVGGGDNQLGVKWRSCLP